MGLYRVVTRADQYPSKRKSLTENLRGYFFGFLFFSIDG